MTILVTGATGHLGGLIIDSLVARDVDPSTIRAGARDNAKASDLSARGVQVVASGLRRPRDRCRGGRRC